MIDGSDSRSQRQRTCDHCAAPLTGGRPDRRFCDARCRRANYDERAQVGTVRSVRRLASGKMSVIVWMDHDTQLVPGMAVRIGEVPGDGERE